MTPMNPDHDTSRGSVPTPAAPGGLLDALSEHPYWPPRLLWKAWSSVVRHGWPDNPLDQSRVVFLNFFLHFHSVKIDRHSLRWTYTLGLGLISFFLFLILSVSGVLLMFYYVPSVEQAYARMLDLSSSVSFGKLLRNVHRIGAHAMVLFVFLHMCRVFFTGSYKKPREFNWVIGVLLLLCTLFLSFSGYLLPWDQLAFWAITVGTAISSYAPGAGEAVRVAMLGGKAVGQEALIRFYVAHVFVLPVVTALLIGLHFWRIRKDGGLSRPGDSERPNVKPY